MLLAFVVLSVNDIERVSISILYIDRANPHVCFSTNCAILQRYCINHE